MKITLFEPDYLRYCYVNPKSNTLHLFVPIAGGDEIGTDNTCQSTMALKDFFGLNVKRPSAAQSLETYLDILNCHLQLLDEGARHDKAERIRATEMYLAMLSSLQNHVGLSKLNPMLDVSKQGYPAGIVQLMDKKSNLFSMQLRPKQIHDYAKAAGTVFSVERKYVSYLANMLQNCNLKNYQPNDAKNLLIEATYQCLGENPTLAQVQEALKAQALKLFGRNANDLNFTHDSRGFAVNVMYIKDILEYEENESLYDKAFIRDIVNACVPTLNELVDVSPFVQIDQNNQQESFSILCQFFLAQINIYCYANNLGHDDFGKTIEMGSKTLSLIHEYLKVLPPKQDKQEALKQFLGMNNISAKDFKLLESQQLNLIYGLQERLNSAIDSKQDLEKAILAFVNDHAAELGLSNPLNEAQQQEIIARFRRQYLNIQASPFFDEFTVLDPTVKGDFCNHQGGICVDFAEMVGAGFEELDDDFHKQMRQDARDLLATTRAIPHKSQLPSVEVDSEKINDLISELLKQKEFAKLNRFLFSKQQDTKPLVVVLQEQNAFSQTVIEQVQNNDAFQEYLLKEIKDDKSLQQILTAFDIKIPIVRAAKYNKPFLVEQILKENPNSVNQTDVYRCSPLMYAVLNSNIKLATTLIQAGADVNIVNTDGEHALYTAIDNKNKEMVSLLLENNADLDHFNEEFLTPLHYVVKKKLSTLLPAFIEHGVNLELVDQNGKTLLQNAISNNDVNSIIILLKAGAYVDDKAADKLNGFLIMAINAGDTELAKALIRQHVGMNAKDNERNRPLMLAIKKGNTDIANALIYKNADYEHSMYATSNLYQAAYKVGKVFLEGFIGKRIDTATHLNVRNKDGLTPLMLAVLNNNTDVLQTLIKEGANLNTQDVTGNTALMLAVSKNNIEALKILINAGANVNIYNNDDRTALYKAIKQHSPEMVRLLIDGWAKKYDAIHLAARENQPEIIQILAKTPQDIEKLTLRNQTPLQVALQAKAHDAVYALIKLGANTRHIKHPFLNQILLHAINNHDTKLAKIMIRKGIGLNTTTKRGVTPLMLAIDTGQTELAQALIYKDADYAERYGITNKAYQASRWVTSPVKRLLGYDIELINVNDFNGVSPLIYAVESNNLDVVNMLIAQGANVNHVDKLGYTALMLAAASGHADIVQALIQAGADITIENTKRETAHVLAKNQKIIKQLDQALAPSASMQTQGSQKTFVTSGLEKRSPADPESPKHTKKARRSSQNR